MSLFDMPITEIVYEDGTILHVAFQEFEEISKSLDEKKIWFAGVDDYGSLTKISLEKVRAIFKVPAINRQRQHDHQLERAKEQALY